MHKVKQHKGVAVAAAVCAVAMAASLATHAGAAGAGVIDWLALSSDWRYQLPALLMSRCCRLASVIDRH